MTSPYDVRRGRLRNTQYALRSGFTLNEMLVAMAIASTVMALAFKLIIGSTEVLRDLRARTALQLQAGEFLDRVADDIHSARSITIVPSEDAERPELQIRHADDTTSRYRWNAEGRQYLRRRGDEAWKPITPSDFIIERLQVNDHDRLVQIALTASLTVRGTRRPVHLKLTTEVQTLG